MFTCDLCKQVFTFKCALIRHLSRKKKCYLVDLEACFECDNCHKKFTRKSRLQDHIVKKICLKTRAIKNRKRKKPAENDVLILNFASNAEFLLWKDAEEQRTLSKYTQNCGSWKTEIGKRIKYICHRAGNARLKSQELRKRPLKRKGSNKINDSCTAYILYTETLNGEVEIHYHPKHTNHEIEMKYLPLSSTDKDRIADRLREGVSMDRILNDIRQTLYNSPSLSRTHLTTKHDLHNINAAYGISFQERLSSNDAVSVDLLVDQYEKKFGDQTPFKYYKRQNQEDPSRTLEKNDIMLVIMDPIQIDTMKKYGHDKICLDSTHSTNQYEFSLTTVMVVNDSSMGVPVAYAVSNKENTVFLKLFFEIIKENCGPIVPAIFMTDDYPAYATAWTEVMGKPSKNLLCLWHVDRNWKKNLNKVKQPFQKEVYKLVRTLMEELDENCFPEIVLRAVEKLKQTPETASFGTYFEKEYSHRYEMWSQAFRKYVGLNTNMKLEAMHRELKTVQFKGIRNRRLDSLITTLLSMTLKKELLRATHLVLDTDTHTLKKIRDRHHAGKSIPKEDLTIIDDETALVQSQSGLGVYSITRVKLMCTCRMRCSECEMCIHMYRCSCADNAAQGNFCKHLHLFGISKLKGTDINNNDQNDVMNEVNGIMQHMQSHAYTPASAEELNLKIKSSASRILKNAENFNANMNGEQVLKLLNEAAKIMEMNSNSMHGNNDQPVKRQPTNKKFEKQIRFFSTKKKRNTKNAVRKPTVHQKIEMKSMVYDVENIPVVISNDFEDHLYRADTV